MSQQIPADTNLEINWEVFDDNIFDPVEDGVLLEFLRSSSFNSDTSKIKNGVAQNSGIAHQSPTTVHVMERFDIFFIKSFFTLTITYTR